MSSGVLGSAAYLPPNVIDNEQISKWIGKDPEWILERTGITQRRYADENDAASDLACRATEALLERYPEARSEIGAVVLATITPDYYTFPSTAAVVQGRMELGRAFAFDLSAACSGFVYSLVTAHGLLSVQENLGEVLVLCADTMSKVMDRSDRKTVTVFGDGATATRVGRVPEGYGILAHRLITDGCNADFVGVAGGSRRPVPIPNVDYDSRHMWMDGRAVRSYFMDVVPKLINEVVDSAGMRIEDIDHFVFHQANPQMLNQCVDYMGLDPAKCPIVGDLTGNIGSGSVAHVLSTMSPKRDDTVLLAAIGGGMTAGVVVLRWY